MPDPTTIPAFVPPNQAELIERQKRMDALLAKTKAAPADAAAQIAQPATTQLPLPVPAQAVPVQATPAPQPAAPAQPALPAASDKTFLEMGLREPGKQVKVFAKEDQPDPTDYLGFKGAKQDVVDAAAKAHVIPSQFARSTVQASLESSAQARDASTARMYSFLKARGYDEPVSLVGEGINLPATVQKMEAAQLTRRAQEMGFPDWFAVPPGPEADKIRAEVNQKVSDDLLYASTIGKGAIFIDPDPIRTNEWLSKLPASAAVTVAALLPHAQGTLTPKGYQLKTEPVVMSLLRPVGAPVAVMAAGGKAALETGLVDKFGAAKEVSAQAFAADAAGDVQQGDILHQQAEDMRAQALNDALAGATGGKDWKDVFLNTVAPGAGEDPEAVKRLVEITRTDPMAVAVADDLADDIERVYKLDGFAMDAIRGTLWSGGLVTDFFGPDPLTPTLAAAGAAARWGARLEGSATDLMKGATAIRRANTAGADIQDVVNAAREAYPGMDEALKLRIAARSRVQPSVVSQVRNLETRAAEMAARVPVAEAKLAAAREATDIAATGRDLAQARLDAAAAQAEVATAHRAFTQEQLDLWTAYGADNIARAEALMAEADQAKLLSSYQQNELARIAQRNAPYVAKVEESNELVRGASETLQETKDAVTDATKLVADAKAQTKAARAAKDKGAVEAALAEQKAAEQALAVAKERQKIARDALKASGEKHAAVMKEASPYIMEQQRLFQRASQLQARAAQLETEAGWRVLSVADDGRAAEHALENGQGILRDSGLMPDINPLDARSTREMIERGRLWGEGLRDAHAEAGRRVGLAMDDYRRANSMLRGASRETQDAAEKALKRIGDLGEAQYGRELAQGRAQAWREEANALADDIERGVEALKRRPKDMSERATNILDGAIVNTAKDGSRSIDTAAFREKMEQQFTPEGVAWWLRHAGDDAPLWRQALGFEPRGSWSYAEAATRNPNIRIAPGEALALQEGQRGLLEGLRRTSGDAAAANQVEALLALRRDPMMTGPAFMDMTPRKFAQHVADQYENWKKMLDPMIAKVGDADEAIVRVSRMGAQRAAIVRDELLMIGRLARAPMGPRQLWKRWGGSAEVIASLNRYMDSTEAMQVFGRSTIFNRGPETVWTRARRQILSSKSLDETAAAAREAAVAEAEGSRAAQWNLIEAQAEATNGGDIANKPLLGLSRMWWPAGEHVNSRASAQLWGAAIEEMRRNSTFEGFAEAMRARTAGVTGGPVEYIPDRAFSFGARNAAQAAVQADMGDMLVRELGGLINAEEAADFNRMITGNADQTTSMARTWETTVRIGAPFTQSSIRDSSRALAQQQELVRLSTTRGGEDVFALTSQVRSLDDTLDKVIKETFARHASARNIGESTLAKHALDMQQWWKTSVTIGMIVPNPRYFMNNLFGNISQIWLTQGLGTAARMTFQGAPSFVPFVGKYFDAAMRATSEAAGDVPVLGSMVNALINPHLNKFFAGEAGTFRSASGIVYDLDTVRQWAADDGILTSFMQEEYGRLFARSRGNSMLTKFRYLQDDLYAWANEIEIRQRSALYLDLLRQGYTRTAARERTLRALYDWHGALTPFESSYITSLIPFYRFMKLGFKQAWYEAIAKPLLKPGEATAEAMRGSSGLARMRNQGLLMRLPELNDDGNYQEEADKFDAMSQYRNLDYLNKRISWTQRNDPNTIDMYQGGRGKYLPYSTIALPAATAIDMGNLVAMTMFALPAMAVQVGGALGMTDKRWTSPDQWQPYWDEATNMSGPIASPFIALAAQTAGYDSQTQQEISRLKPGEAALAQSLGWVVGMGAKKLGYNEHEAKALSRKFDPTQVGLDYQATFASAGTAAIVRGLPFLMQVPQWLDALQFENPAREALMNDPSAKDVADYFTWGARQVTNFGRSFPMDPDSILTQRQKKFAEEIKNVAGSQEGELREQQSTPP